MTRLLAPLSLLVLGAIMFVAGNQLLFPHDGGYLVRAEFADASGLYKDSAVKIGGVTGGIVDSVALTVHDTALVTMTLDHGAAPIGAGATASIRPVNLLGENYVELTPGDLHQPSTSGATIPLRQTAHAVQLDDVLNTLDPDTRLRLQILINETGVALDGHGADFNALLAQLPPSLDQDRRLLAGLGSDNQRLGQLISEGDRVITAMHGRSPDLQNLLANAAATLQAVANRRGALAATIQDAPAALVQTRVALDELGRAATELRPMGTALQAAAPPVAATLTALSPFAQAAKPALRSLAQNAPMLEQLSTGALPAVRKLAPVAGKLSTFAGQLAPVTTALDSGHAFRDLLRLMFGWARTIQQRDGLGHIFGLRLTINPSDLTSAIQRLLKLHPGHVTAAHDHPRSSAGSRPSSASAGAPPTPPPGQPPSPIARVQHLVNSAGAAVKSTVGGLTSPSQPTGKQLQGLLSYLLGR
jgi:phospholipid/cholesterol/gamma-HCH transport system substrate-binding protein